MAGQEVTRNELDLKMARTLVAARTVVSDLETINAFLDRPEIDGVDLLTAAPAEGGFGYSTDEAYLIRSTFQQLAGIRPTIGPILEAARGLTGLL